MNSDKNFERIRFVNIIFIMAVMALLLTISTQRASGNSGIQPNLPNQITRIENNKTALEPTEKLTAWKIMQWCDWLFWPFIIITAAGIMLITYRTLFEHREKTRSDRLLQEKIKANSIRGLVQIIRSSNSTRASRLMYQVITTFDKTNRAEPIGDDINQFLASERDSFETFIRINGFLSESAGALGLLGTVWGIFQTFHAGRLDGPMILQGMSIALVTTLVGLIISLVLNMGGTYVFTLFNGQLNLIANKAEELRQALLYMEKKSNGNGQSLRENISKYRVSDPGFKAGKQHQPIDLTY